MPVNTVAFAGARYGGLLFLMKPDKEGIHFSPRQREILKYLLEGKTNKQISYHLGIAMPTVSFHMKSIAEKLNVQNSREIVPKVLSLGIVDVLGLAEED